MHETVSLDLDRNGGEALQERPFLHLLLRADRPLLPGARWALEGQAELLLGRAGGSDGAPGALPDARVSSSHAVLRRVDGGWQVQDLGSKNGTWVNGRRVQAQPLEDGDLLEVGHTFLLFRGRSPAPAGLPRVAAAGGAGGVEGLTTLVPALAETFARIERIAPTLIPICITGETGTGKEVAARAIHRLSRRAGPLVAVNCGAISRTLLESELFGYRKGAFSGADEDRPGLVRSADGGTLFLDELAELSAEARAGLLRVLQESEVLPVGGTRPVKVDLRLVVATHRNLEALVASGEFRADLLARVSGFRLLLPPLRERREDLGSLIAACLRRHAPERLEVALSPDAARALLLHRWPLNVRELEKCLATALALSGAGPIELAHLAEQLRRPDLASGPPAPAPRPAPAGPLSEAEAALRLRLVEVLRAHRGNVTAAAVALGEHRTQLHRWCKRLGVDPEAYRGEGAS